VLRVSHWNVALVSKAVMAWKVVYFLNSALNSDHNLYALKQP